jgi:hypothetical protein
MAEHKLKEPPEANVLTHGASGRDVLFALASAWSASAGRPITLSRSLPTPESVGDNPEPFLRRPIQQRVRMKQRQ